jgi:hypothetical protein
LETKDFICSSGVKPKISIDKIIFGYRLKPETKLALTEIVMANSDNYKNKFKFSDSPLFENFRDKSSKDGAAFQSSR